MGHQICDVEALLWLSCNGCAWGLGPTAAFACSSAVFLYREVEVSMPATIRERSEHNIVVRVMENCMMITMVLGMLALMIHLWVCSTQFLRYYLEAAINDFPNVIIEVTTSGLLGGFVSRCRLESTTRFLRSQQDNIHMTACWFLALCYADYVRRLYCGDLHIPYIQDWKTQLHAATVDGVKYTVRHVSSAIGAINERVRTFSDELARRLGDPQPPRPPPPPSPPPPEPRPSSRP